MAVALAALAAKGRTDRMVAKGRTGRMVAKDRMGAKGKMVCVRPCVTINLSIHLLNYYVANNGGNNDAANNGGNNNGANNGGNNNNNNNNGGDLCLQADAVQTGSAQDGSEGADEGQATSETDNANFINFCSGKTLTNGLQTKGGSCNGVPMGDIPASSNMVSTVITSPVPGNEPQANEDFDVTVKIANMQLGTFTNPDSTYYSAPQQLSSNGDVIGHTHVVIQDLGNSLTPAQPLDAEQFAFFKGINDAGDGQGTLTATVTGGLPDGNYRVCTMAGASNHQVVLMPVAQRFVTRLALLSCIDLLTNLLIY